MSENLSKCEEISDEGAEAAQEAPIGDANVTAEAADLWKDLEASKVTCQEDSVKIITYLKTELERLKSENATLLFQKSESEEKHSWKEVEIEFSLLNATWLLLQEQHSNLQLTFTYQDAEVSNLLNEIENELQDPSLEATSKCRKLANLETRCEAMRRAVREIELEYRNKFPINEEDISNLLPSMIVNEHVAEFAEIARDVLEILDGSKRQQIRFADMQRQLVRARDELWIVRNSLSWHEEGSRGEGNIVRTLQKIIAKEIEKERTKKIYRGNGVDVG